ncbi:hypothetical protein RN001_002568 [Aquatica leii]|uniref:Uncharacterized protein n=1 Tax=Aquatica leii TaxID=1421715 RepID=A0AAN7Q8R6_9COLE|nr:hypothetical protein RN001_002568 [Aquatica leii]
MNTLTIVTFACLVLYASAGGIYGGHGVHVVPAGPTTLIGASGVVGPNGAAGPAGVVNGHGAVGPNGLANAVHGGVVAGPAVVGVNGLGLAPVGYAGLGLAHAYDDGQWRGEGLWESQDHAGAAYGAHGLDYGARGLAYGLGYGHW